MARISYADPDRPENRALADRIRVERGDVLHLYRMLLHSPPIAEGWLGYLTNVRQRCGLAGDLRELVIMLVAHLNGAPYEADQHAPIARKEGVADEKLAALPDWERSHLFTPRERAVLAYTRSMTRDIHVPDEVFEQVRREFDERSIVELTAIIAAYNMVSRFLEALQIHSHDSV